MTVFLVAFVLVPLAAYHGTNLVEARGFSLGY
jgi:hypothetical protein